MKGRQEIEGSFGPSTQLCLVLPCTHICCIETCQSTTELISGTGGVQARMGLHPAHDDVYVDSSAVTVVTMVNGLHVQVALPSAKCIGGRIIEGSATHPGDLSSF